MPDSIYLVQYNVQRDSYSGWYWDDVPQVEDGYYLTHEAAQAEVNRLNRYTERYQEYVNDLTRKNEQALAGFAKRLDDHEKAKAAGLEHLAPAPVRADVRRPLDFDDWKSNLREESYYDVIEVKPHE